jgi:lipopolysaccharide heptosyltransferase III
LILKKYQHAQICIIGTDKDEIPDSLPCDDRIVDLRSRLSLSETAWILQNSDIAIGNDCGPMHIADAVQTCSIVIFGPSCELKNAYRNKVTPVFGNVPCRPCQYNEGRIMSCDDPQCMLRIAPDDVMEKLTEII